MAKNVTLIVTIENLSLHLQKCVKNVSNYPYLGSTALMTVLQADIFLQKIRYIL